MKLFEKFQPLAATRAQLAAFGTLPIGVVTERIVSATEGLIEGRRVILAGTNNYLGLTFERECIEAAQRAVRVLPDEKVEPVGVDQFEHATPLTPAAPGSAADTRPPGP